MENAVSLSIVEFDQPFMVSIPGGKLDIPSPNHFTQADPASAPDGDGFPSILMPRQERGVVKTNRYDFF
jgi:hypothetical protein